MPGDAVKQGTLEIGHRLVAADPWQAKMHQRGADVLVLVLDRSAGAADELLQSGVAVGLGVGPARQFERQHVEIVGEDQVDLAHAPFRSRRPLSHA